MSQWKVLVVDDEPVFFELIKNSLGSENTVSMLKDRFRFRETAMPESAYKLPMKVFELEE
jgi:CheY-like chemotaxis protein